MKQPMNRRDFLMASSLVAAGLSVAAGSSASPAPDTPSAGLSFKTRPHKALIARPTEDDLKSIKEAGFDGVEGRSSTTPETAARMRAVAESLGMRIHSVLIDRWGEFNNPDPSVVEKSFADTEAALRTAEAFGADTVLLVPGRIGGGGGRGAAVLPMPRPWEFQIEFDERNGHLTRVVYGDNAPYAEYMKAHDEATDRVGSSRVDLQACKLEYSIVSPK